MGWTETAFKCPPSGTCHRGWDTAAFLAEGHRQGSDHAVRLQAWEAVASWPLSSTCVGLLGCSRSAHTQWPEQHELLAQGPGGQAKRGRQAGGWGDPGPAFWVLEGLQPWPGPVFKAGRAAHTANPLLPPLALVGTSLMTWCLLVTPRYSPALSPCLTAKSFTA